jgi:hypothetical protein
MRHIPTRKKAEQVSANTFPPHYQSWLDFYDSLSPDIQHGTGEITWAQFFTAHEYRHQFGAWPPALNRDNEILVGSKVNREFMLARIAEQLLAARLDKTAIEELRSKQYTADSDEASEACRAIDSILESSFIVAPSK